MVLEESKIPMIPEAMLIESAADALKRVPIAQLADQIKELETFGAARLQELGASGLTDDVRVGYNLALQVARTVLATEPKLYQAKIDPAMLL